MVIVEFLAWNEWKHGCVCRNQEIAPQDLSPVSINSDKSKEESPYFSDELGPSDTG